MSSEERYKEMADELAKHLRTITEGWVLDKEIGAEPTILKRDLNNARKVLAQYDWMRGEE